MIQKTIVAILNRCFAIKLWEQIFIIALSMLLAVLDLYGLRPHWYVILLIGCPTYLLVSRAVNGRWFGDLPK